VTREAGRRYKYRIKANIEDMVIGMKRQPNLRCCGYAAALVRRDRPFRVRKLPPRFHFHEYQELSTAGDQVDFA